ncbi:MAG TPA: adenosylcobinamide-GDP ribazoletransferase [Beijerinckiaceae bacterium]|jgi:adenosylcobinamide-GDP ribazoletransferase
MTRREIGDAARAILTDLARCLRFYSRLPVPTLPWEGDPHGIPDFRTMPRVLPVAGALLGAIGAAVLYLADALHLGSWLAAALAVASLTLVTGAFHEDGLADMADAFGGATPERRLEIMRDSRIGSYGTAALVLAYALRIGALSTLLDRNGPGLAAAALVLAGALSRTAGLLAFRLAPPARSTGAAYAVGQPSAWTVTVAWTLAGLLGLALDLAALLPLPGTLLAFGFAAAAAVGLTRVAVRLVGGHTGDVAGAIQQVSEVAILLALLIGAPR